MKEQYVFDGFGTATGAANFINASTMFPLDTGQDVITDKYIDHKYIGQRETDGKYYFERIPQQFREQLDAAVVATFNSSFQHTIEEFNRSWLPIDV